MNFLEEKNIQQLMELGSGRVLTNLAKRGSNQIEAFNIETVEDIKNILNNFA